MITEFKPIYYGIPDFHMYLKNTCENKDQYPSVLESIDLEEKEAIDREYRYIEKECQSYLTAIKISSLILGVAMGICISVLTGTLLGFEDIDRLGQVGSVLGGMFGYCAGVIRDKYFLASRRFAVFRAHIIPARIARLENKLDKVRAMISECREDNVKKNLISCEKFLDKRLSKKEDYSRIYEFLYSENT